MGGWFAGVILRIFGWRWEGTIPDDEKLVVIGAPHTSNWDFLLMVLYTKVLGTSPSWIGKHTLFRPPFRGFFRALGGIPVDRSRRQNLVEQVVEGMRRRDRVFLIITPEGTRGASGYWRTGFYHIAREAGVRILMGYVDGPKKMLGLGPAFTPGDDIDQVFDVLREFYADKTGINPELTGEIRRRPPT